MEILAWACCHQPSDAAIIVFRKVPLAVNIIYG